MLAPLAVARALVSRSCKGLTPLYVFLGVLVLLLLSYREPVQNKWNTFRASHLPLQISEHPIEGLTAYYRDAWKKVIETQSTTVDQAVERYQQRYHREPPPGFDKWFEFAKKLDSPIIDNYDTIEQSLRHLRHASPEELRNAVKSGASGNSRACSWSTTDGHANLHRCDWMGGEMQKFLGLIQNPLPDTESLMNSLDEPRVLYTPGHSDDGVWHDFSHQSVWNQVTQTCRAERWSPERHPEAKRIGESAALPFVGDVVDAKDLCKHPEYANMHGFFQSPTTFLFTELPVSIFSPARPSTFSDILYPPPYYFGKRDQGQYQENEDPDWESKRPELYWAGSTTGSQANSENWRTAHRQRFVARVNALSNSTATFLTETSPNTWEFFKSQEIFSQLYDVKFTAVIQCARQQCDAERSFFALGDREGQNAGMQHKFIFDLDGNSFSGRFYTLLESKSVVLKQTIFNEWHDDRLMPWVHYVPVSLDMGELPEMMRFLALTERGDEISKEIAMQGREWERRALRREDAAVYMYRLLLELGRIMNAT